MVDNKTSEAKAASQSNVKRLRALKAMTPPICCRKPMVATYLHLDHLTDEQKSALTEAQEADRLADALLRPVWACEKCDHEVVIEGIDWPEPEEAVVSDEPSKPSGKFKYCPHCGKSL